MSTIVTRAGKGSPLSNTELDTNFTNLNADKLEANRTNPLAQAVRVAMTAATSGSNGIQVLDNVQGDFGTTNFTLSRKMFVATTRPTANRILSQKHDATNGRIITLLTTGVIRLTINAATFDSTVALPSLTDTVLDLAISVIRETASVAGSVTFYSNGVIVGAAVTITAGAPTTVDNAVSEFMLGTSAVRTAGELYQSLNYNRALSAAEVLRLCVNGPALADLGASQTPITTFNFSVGTDSFVGGNCTITGNIDSIGGKDNTLRAVTTNADFARWSRTYGNAQLLKNGRIVAEFYRPSGNVTATGVQLRLNIGTTHPNATVVSTEQLPADAWTTVQFTVPPTTTTDQTSIAFYFVDAAGSALNNTSGDIIYMASDGTYTQTGITGQWNAENAQSNTGQIFDSSGNKNHALLPAAGATIIGKPVSGIRQVRWTNTWAGTNELQYIGGVNQAILPANAYIDSIIGTVSGATVEDIIIGDGSDTDRYVTITTGLAAGTTTFTLANRTTDGTNLKLTVDPDTNSDMSIAWVISYRVLE